RAVDQVSEAAAQLLESLTTNAPPKDRAEQARKARERNQRRFGNA
ncbi:MAG: DUF2277 family protein, partial [Myxococcales bacterium]|nr:DUF2277 family protein [Myxococcales bacterium]